MMCQVLLDSVIAHIFAECSKSSLVIRLYIIESKKTVKEKPSNDGLLKL